MNRSIPGCPHCGARRFVIRTDRRRVIKQGNQRVELLTRHARKAPVIEETVDVYCCPCSWSGTRDELESGG